MSNNLDIAILHKKIDLLSKELCSEVSDYFDAVLQKSTALELEEKIETHLASERIIAKDWLSKHEEEVWKDL